MATVEIGLRQERWRCAKERVILCSWFVLTVPLLIGSIIAFLFVQNQTLKINRLNFLNLSFLFITLYVGYVFLIQTSFKFVVSSQMLDHIFSFHIKNNNHSEFIDCFHVHNRNAYPEKEASGSFLKGCQLQWLSCVYKLIN